MNVFEIMEQTAESKRLADVFNANNWTNSEMASLLGYKDSSIISLYLSGSRPIAPQFLFKLEKKTGISADWVKTGKGPQMISGFHDESVYNKAKQSGSFNEASVHYKTGASSHQQNEALQRLKDAEQQIRNLTRENEVLRELNALLKENNTLLKANNAKMCDKQGGQ